MTSTPMQRTVPTCRDAVTLLRDLRPHRHEDYLEVSAYRRGAYGPTWWDPNHTGLSTRDAVLEQQLRATQYVGPRLISGILDDPYTGRTVQYSNRWFGVELDEAAGDDLVVVDHVVSLWEAWTAGAWAWPHARRLDFANDPLNLWATTWTVNRDKGALSASQWHPEHRDRAANFARQVVQAKHAYGLEVTRADYAWLLRALKRGR